MLVKLRAGRKCERCGSNDRLNAHHKDHDHANNKLSNGECLCHLCHFKHHRKHGGDVQWLKRKKSMSKAQRARRKREGKPMKRKYKRLKCPVCKLETTPGPMKQHRERMKH